MFNSLIINAKVTFFLGISNNLDYFAGKYSLYLNYM